MATDFYRHNLKRARQALKIARESTGPRRFRAANTANEAAAEAAYYAATDADERAAQDIGLEAADLTRKGLSEMTKRFRSGSDKKD